MQTRDCKSEHEDKNLSVCCILQANKTPNPRKPVQRGGGHILSTDSMVLDLSQRENLKLWLPCKFVVKIKRDTHTLYKQKSDL